MSEDDEATAHAFIAYYLHDVAASADEYGHRHLILVAATERHAWEVHGRLEGNTPHFVYGWALQDAAKAAQAAIDGRGSQAEWEEASDRMHAVRRWLIANGYPAIEPAPWAAGD